MKKSSNALNFIYAFLLSAGIMLISAVVLAFILLKSGMGNELVGFAAAISVFVASLAGSIYSGRTTNNPYSCLISGGIFLAVLALIGLGTSGSQYSIPFAVPLACIAGGVLPFIALSKSKKSTSKQVKRAIKRRKSFG